MSEQTNSNQQTVVLALVVIAVLLAAIVGVLIWKQTDTASVATPAAPADGGTAAQAPTGMGQAPATEFDPAKAPKVPAGTEPEAYVKEYYQLCQDGKYDQAYKMLPVDTQSYYGNTEQFKSTLEGYGITGFEVKAGTSTDSEVQVIGIQEAQGMSFAYTWTLVKEGDTWLVKSRVMGGQ